MTDHAVAEKAISFSRYRLIVHASHVFYATIVFTWFRAIAPCKPRVVLTHGEDEPRQILAEKIQQRFKLKSARPGMGETIEL